MMKDELTLHRAQKGDAQAFERLMTPYESMVWRVCWHYVPQREDAQDCAQEVMLKAWRSIASYRRDCTLETWIYRICMSVCVDFLRRKRRQPLTESTDVLLETGFDPPSQAPEPDDILLSAEASDELRAAMDQLPADMRTVLILYAFEEQSYEDIARVTGAAVGTVKSRLSRAREKISRYLAMHREQNGSASVQHSERRTAQ